MRINTPPLPSTLLALIITVVCCANVSAQEPQPPQNSRRAASDPIEQLQLLPEQRQKIRAIRESTREERAMINLRLRQANIALQQALDVDNPDDAVIEQRLRNVAAAQADSMRMRVLTEVKIRRVLTPEQVAILKSLQATAQDPNQNPRRPVREGNVLRPNQRGMAPLFPRRDGAQRNPRP